MESGTWNGAEKLRAIFAAAVEAVRADVLFERGPAFMELRRASRGTEHIAVVGAGKAAIPMAVGAEKALDHAVDVGLVVVPRGYVESLPSHFHLPTHVEIVESGHPIPSGEGAGAGARMLEVLRGYGSDDLVVVLISGGASALLSTPAPGITIEDVSSTTAILLRSGASIQKINTIRKHLTAIGGGRLAQTAYPATVINYIISDVIGNDPSFVGSGPCAPDDTTFRDARNVIDQYRLWNELPETVTRHLRTNAPGSASDTPDADDEIFETVALRMLGTNEDALAGARKAALDLGLQPTVRKSDLCGEARHVGVGVARMISEAEPGTCLIWGGETTVTVRGDGVGGRNHELVLAAALELDRLGGDATILSAGTDGIDGMTRAAGAWADGKTIARARSMGLDPKSSLENNDSGTFFEALGQQVVTGATHTNVMDVVIANR